MSWDVFVDAFPFVVKGLKITVLLTFTCYIFALIVGFVWVFFRRIPIKSIRWIIGWIMEFIRSTPPLVQLFFLYYGLPVITVIGVILFVFKCTYICFRYLFSNCI